MLMIGLLLWRDVIHISLLRPCIAHSFISLLKERELQVKLSTETALNTENTLTLTRIFTTVVQLRHRIALRFCVRLSREFERVRLGQLRNCGWGVRVQRTANFLENHRHRHRTIYTISPVYHKHDHDIVRQGKKAASQQHQLLLSWL